MRPTAVATLIAVAFALASAGLVLGATSRPHRVYLPAVSCAGCAGAAPVPTTPPAPSPVPTTPPNTSDYAARMIALVNQARAAVGCPAVTPHPILMSGAQAWSETMVATHNYVHSPADWYAGYIGGGVENIAGGAETPEYAFQAWMASAAHKANIETCYPEDDPSYNPARIYEVGVGFQSGLWTLAISWRIP